MNKTVAAALSAGAILAAALTGCKGTTAVSASHSAQASAAAQDAKTAASNAVTACLPKGKQTEANLIQIALSASQRDKLGKCLEIPKANRHAFAAAAASSALKAYQAGDFKTKGGRTHWAEQDLPLVVEKYQAK